MGLECPLLPKDEDLLKVSKLCFCNGTGKWGIFLKKKDFLVLLRYIF